MNDLLTLFGAITAGFYFVMLLTPFRCGHEAQDTSCIVDFLGRTSVRHHVPGVSFFLKMWVVFFAWVGLMVWAGFDVQIGKGEAID